VSPSSIGLNTEWTSFQPAKVDHFSTGLDRSA
jgi:hypothetical protein